MLHILGIGSAYPSNEITNSFLGDLGGGASSREIERSYGIKNRRTVLPLDYIRDTLNIDPRATWKIAESTPTDLAVRAAEEAIARAGISVDKIGLVIGETATPLETAPAEGQRVAGRLGLRVPAYDLSGSAATLALQVDTLRRWRSEVVPDYVLLVSVNTPTTRVNFSAGQERYFFGDAASAMVVSRKVSGKFGVVDSFFGVQPAYSDSLTVDTFAHTKMRADLLNEFVEPRIDEMFMRGCKAATIEPASAILLSNQASAVILSECCSRHGIAPERCWSNLVDCGHSLGSVPACVLAERWNMTVTNQRVIVSLAGAGMSFGYLVLKG